MYQLRPYQERCVGQSRQAIRDGHRSLIIEAPTAAGKTVFCCGGLIIPAMQKGKKVVFLASQRELVRQCSGKLHDYEVPHGILMAGDSPDWSQGVQVASKDTLHSRAIRRKRMPIPEADLVVVDECHESMAPTYITLIKHFIENGAIIIGLSATPARTDGRGLGDVFTKMIKMASYSELIRDGFLVPTRCFAPAGPSMKGVDTDPKTKDWVIKQAGERMNKRRHIGDVFKTFMEIAPGRQFIGYGVTIAHSMHLAEVFQAEGLEVAHLDGTMPIIERDQILYYLRTGKLQGVFNCNVLTQGFDCPPISCIINDAPTKSIIRWRQRCGRAMRPYDDKQDCIVIDHTGSYDIHFDPDMDMDWPLLPTTRLESASERTPPERQPIVCKKCHFAYQGVPECPNCGEPAPSRRPKPMRRSKGRLTERTKRDSYRDATTEELQRSWDQFMYIAKARGLKMNAVAGMYRGRWGVWPRGLKRVPRGKAQWHITASRFIEEYVSRLGAERVR